MRRDEEVLSGIDSEGFLGDGGDDLDAKGSELLGAGRLRAAGWDGRRRLFKRCGSRRPSGQIKRCCSGVDDLVRGEIFEVDGAETCGSGDSSFGVETTRPLAAMPRFQRG